LGRKIGKEKKKEISSSKDVWKKRKLLGMRYFNRAQRTVKENKTVLFQSFLVGRNARIKLFENWTLHWPV
jgi:hypothetical protein